MEEAGGYFFGQGSGRSEPGLDSPSDCKSLDRPKYSIGMHTAKFARPKNFGYRALDYQGRKLQLAQAFTRPHKNLSGAVRRAAVEQILQRFPLHSYPVLQPGN